MTRPTPVSIAPFLVALDAELEALFEALDADDDAALAAEEPLLLDAELDAAAADVDAALAAEVVITEAVPDPLSACTTLAIATCTLEA